VPISIHAGPLNLQLLPTWCSAANGRGGPKGDIRLMEYTSPKAAIQTGRRTYRLAGQADLPRLRTVVSFRRRLEVAVERTGVQPVQFRQKDNALLFVRVRARNCSDHFLGLARIIR